MGILNLFRKPKPVPEIVRLTAHVRSRRTGQLVEVHLIDGAGWRMEHQGRTTTFPSFSDVLLRYERTEPRDPKVVCTNCGFFVNCVPGFCTAKITPKLNFVTGERILSALPCSEFVNPDGNCPYFRAKRVRRRKTKGT